MNTYYQANGWVKFYEEDIYQEGCIPHTGGIIDGNQLFKAETLDGLLQQLLDFTGGDSSCMELNSCDEAGRVDISIMENADGCKAAEWEIESWKEADIQLWDCIYTFQIEKITAEAVNLEEITA
jgi:hypothetical protein